MSDSEESIVSDAVSEQSPSEEEDYDDEGDEDNDKPNRKRKKLSIFDADDVYDESGETGEKWEEGDEDIIDHKTVHEGPSAEYVKEKQQSEATNCDKEDKSEENYCQKFTESPKEFGEGEEISDEISQQGLLPSVQDPNIWMVRCRMGEEKSTAMLLMRKFFTYQFTEELLQIKSVIAKEGLKGYIYIEAFKQTHVKQAIEGVGSLRMGRFRQRMVPIQEITDVLKVIHESTNLKPKSWVRLNKGIYQHDLAQVVYAEPDMNLIHLKLLPRIDYRIDRSKRRNLNSSRIYDEYVWRTRRHVKQKLFDVDAIKAIGGKVTINGDFFIFESNRYNRKGFLFKSFAMSAITEDPVEPTASEIENFEKGIVINLDPFIAGDKVEVYKEGFTFLEGKVITFDANKVTIMPKSEDFKEPLEFQIDDVHKHFEVGDHVKVIRGCHINDTGIVVDIQDMVIIFSDSTMKELNFWHDDLQLCTDLENDAAVLASNCRICSVLALDREDSS